MTDNPKPKYNSLKLLIYFVNKYNQNNETKYIRNDGRDLAILKRIRTLFEEYYDQLGDPYAFIDFCLEQNKGRTIDPRYLLNVTKKKLGVVKQLNKGVKPPLPSTDELDQWIETEQVKWQEKFKHDLN